MIQNRFHYAIHSFHGRTIATLTATGQPKYHEGFGPLPEGFDYVPYNDIEALEKLMSDKTAAVMLEPSQSAVCAERTAAQSQVAIMMVMFPAPVQIWVVFVE